MKLMVIGPYITTYFNDVVSTTTQRQRRRFSYILSYRCHCYHRYQFVDILK